MSFVVGSLIVRPLNAQAAQTDMALALAFEVASVKLHTTSGINERSGIEETPGLIRVENLPLKGLIEAAYGVKDYQFSGPGWLDTARYDVLAKPPAGFTQSQLRPLLQTMLADRFKLKVHYRSNEMAAYGLVIAKSRSKLQESTGSRTFFTARPGLISGTRVSMHELAAALSGILDRPTADQTGLHAAYDVKVQWTPDSATGDLGVSLFTALTEQLGLRLVPTRNLVDVLVVDQVERPTPD
jgi:uncharacterized protein (TIGR03435 family)